MLITTSLAVAAFTTAVAAAATSTSSVPPLVIRVAVESDAPASLVSRALAEADAVWRASGITFIWDRVPAKAASRFDQNRGGAAGGLRVVIGNSRGAVHEGRMPLGWIQFDSDSPAQEIYLSYRNAVDFMADSTMVVGVLSRMPALEQEFNLARAMGRALAHELGHYLLASKAHTRGGLMQASHTAHEFFGYARNGFRVDAAQRQLIAARLQRDAVVVQR